MISSFPSSLEQGSATFSAWRAIFLVNHSAPTVPPPNVQTFIEQQLYSANILKTTVWERQGQYIKTIQFNHRSILIHTHHSHTEIGDHIQKLINFLAVLPRDFY